MRKIETKEELIAKRYNSKKTLKRIGRLIYRSKKLSGLPMHTASSKFKKIIKPCKCDNLAIKYYNDPTELLNELEIIIGSLKSGNTSPLLLNKGIKIIDELFQKGFINEEQHENLYNKLI